MADFESRVEYGIKWDEPIAGLPDITHSGKTLGEVAAALDGSAYSGRVVARRVLTGRWSDLEIGGE